MLVYDNKEIIESEYDDIVTEYDINHVNNSLIL